MTYDAMRVKFEQLSEKKKSLSELILVQHVIAGGLGNWSDRGCKFAKNEAGRVKCHCDHMTNFAVLFSASGPRKHDEKNAMALSIISYVGCAISLVGLTLTLMTYALFRFVEVWWNFF